MERKKITFDSFIRGSIGCVLVVGILMLVERLSGVLLPFFIAWLIAYMVYPLVKFFQYKLRLKSRIISIFCSLFLITVIGVTLFYLLVPPMISEIGRMNDLLVTYLTNGAGNNVPKSLSEFIQHGPRGHGGAFVAGTFCAVEACQVLGDLLKLFQVVAAHHGDGFHQG